MNNTHLDQARAWADDSSYQGDALSVAAARVIQSLPDEWIDAEKVRELIDTYKHARDGNAAGTEGWVMNHLVVRNLESLLAPPLPTLADMTPEERQACVGMWCDNLASTAKEPSPVVLDCVQGDLCWVLHTDLHGQWSCFPLDKVAPRPDLIRAWRPDGTPVATTEEVEYRIVDPDTNGGRYELRRWSRHVTEWSTDE